MHLFILIDTNFDRKKEVKSKGAGIFIENAYNSLQLENFRFSNLQAGNNSNFLINN